MSSVFKQPATGPEGQGVTGVWVEGQGALSVDAGWANGAIPREGHGRWELRNVSGEPVWVWFSAWGWMAFVDDVDFDKLIERGRTGWLTLDNDGHPRLNNRVPLVSQLFGRPLSDMAWEAVNGNRADVRLCNVAMVDHTHNVGLPGVHTSDGLVYFAAANGRRVGEPYEDELDAYLSAVDATARDWLTRKAGIEYGLDEM